MAGGSQHLKNKTLSQVVTQPGDSHFRARLMKVKDPFLEKDKFSANNGDQTRFWEFHY